MRTSTIRCTVKIEVFLNEDEFIDDLDSVLWGPESVLIVP